MVGGGGGGLLCWPNASLENVVNGFDNDDDDDDKDRHFMIDHHVNNTYRYEI